jgi:hypothetical protein
VLNRKKKYKKTSENKPQTELNGRAVDNAKAFWHHLIKSTAKLVGK